MTMQIFRLEKEAKRYAKREAKERAVPFLIFQTMAGSSAHNMGYDFIAMSNDDTLRDEALIALEVLHVIKPTT